MSGRYRSSATAASHSTCSASRKCISLRWTFGGLTPVAVTGQPPTLNGRSEDLREHLKRFAGTLWGQTISQEVRPPLLHGKSVDRG
jgi:hypothetical protein